MQDLGSPKLSRTYDSCIDFTVSPVFETNSRDTGEAISIIKSAYIIKVTATV